MTLLELIKENKAPLTVGTIAGIGLFYKLNGYENLAHPYESFMQVGEETLRPIALGLQIGLSVLAGISAGILSNLGRNLFKKRGVYKESPELEEESPKEEFYRFIH